MIGHGGVILPAQSAHSHHPRRPPPKLSNLVWQSPRPPAMTAMPVKDKELTLLGRFRSPLAAPLVRPVTKPWNACRDWGRSESCALSLPSLSNDSSPEYSELVRKHGQAIVFVGMSSFRRPTTVFQPLLGVDAGYLRKRGQKKRDRKTNTCVQSYNMSTFSN